MKTYFISATFLLFAFISQAQTMENKLKDLEKKVEAEEGMTPSTSPTTTPSSSPATTPASPTTTTSPASTPSSSTATPASSSTSSLQNAIATLEKYLALAKSALSKKDNSLATKYVASAKSALTNVVTHPTASGLTSVDYKGMLSDFSQLEKALKAKNTSTAQTAITDLQSKLSVLKVAAN